MLRPIIVALMLLAFAACSRNSAPPPAAPAPATPAVAQPTTPASEAAPAAGQADSPQAATQQAAAQQEQSESPDEEDRAQAKSDNSLEHLASMPADAQLPAGRWQAGVNYLPVVPAQPTSVAPGKVEVLEVFWLGCPHCYELEPFLQTWLRTKPDWIQFVRVHIMWGPGYEAHAKLFYALQALGRSDLVPKAFEVIHQEHRPLVANSEDETLRVQEEFAKENGIRPEDFAKALHSFTVSSDLARAKAITERYQVRGVPFIAINGKYSTGLAEAGNPQNLLAIINDLAAAEHNKKHQ